MYKKIFMSVIFIFVLTLLLNGLSFAQNNNDCNQSSGTMKMNEHMVMEHNQSKQSDSAIVRKGEIGINQIDQNKDCKVYEDMMDYNVISDKPGTCPLCGMTLKEVSLEKAKSNLSKNGFTVK
jgi:hypothetical protein